MALMSEPWYYQCNKLGKVRDILRKRSERHRKKTLGVLVEGCDRIPEHLIVEILSRLPVTTLLRFKTVCKSWYAIIKSSHFITKHLRNYYDNDNNWRDRLILQYTVTQAGELNVFELLIDDKKNRSLAHQEIRTPIYNTYLCGPCDGIYYQWIYYECSPSRKRSMWNPALNELIILPDIPLDPVFTHESYGFGYDSKTKDYKVILIFGKEDENSMTILIYSLKTNSWRHWGDISKSYKLQQNKSYVYVNGCYYWLAWRLLGYRRNYEMIVVFDIAGDAYHEIRLPHFESKPGFSSHVCVFRDSIAFVNIPDNASSGFSVWTLSDGVWSPRLKIKYHNYFYGAVGNWRDNTLIIIVPWCHLMLYDTNTREKFHLNCPREATRVLVNICAYKESLVSMIGFQKDNKPQISS